MEVELQGDHHRRQERTAGENGQARRSRKRQAAEPRVRFIASGSAIVLTSGYALRPMVRPAPHRAIGEWQQPHQTRSRRSRIRSPNRTPSGTCLRRDASIRNSAAADKATNYRSAAAAPQATAGRRRRPRFTALPLRTQASHPSSLRRLRFQAAAPCSPLPRSLTRDKSRAGAVAHAARRRQRRAIEACCVALSRSRRITPSHAVSERASEGKGGHWQESPGNTGPWRSRPDVGGWRRLKRSGAGRACVGLSQTA